MNCEQYQELIYLAHYDELDEAAIRILKRHLESCPLCAVEKTRADNLYCLMDKKKSPQVDLEWLKSARNQLLARLQISQKRVHLVSIDWGLILRFFQHPAVRVAYSAIILVAGIFVGKFTCRSSTTLLPQIGVSKLAASDQRRDIVNLLQEGNVRNVDIKELPQQQVQVTFQGVKDYQVVGTAQDQNIQELLAYILLHESNDGLRLRALEAIAQKADSLAQNLLCYATINDDNPGIRLKAVRYLLNFPLTEQIQQVFMRALMTDNNSAVRIEAIEGLRKTTPNAQVLSVVNIAAAKDSNEYVKLLAKNALEKFQSQPVLQGEPIEKLK
jgi:HEAT repeat protein